MLIFTLVCFNVVYLFLFVCLSVYLFNANSSIVRCSDDGDEDWLDLGILRTTWQCDGKPKVLGIIDDEYEDYVTIVF